MTLAGRHRDRHRTGRRGSPGRGIGTVARVDADRPIRRSRPGHLAARPRRIGLRPMSRTIAADDWLLRTGPGGDFGALQIFDLTFDGLGAPRLAEAFSTLFRRNPGPHDIDDYGQTPPVATGPTSFDAWNHGISLRAGIGAVCKISGVATWAGADWTIDDLRLWTDHLLTASAPACRTWGSNGTVLPWRTDDRRWDATAIDRTASLNAAGKTRIPDGTATDFFRFRQ